MKSPSGDVAEPILAAPYSLSKVTLYPLILLVFGLGLSAKIAFGAIRGIAPVIVFAMNAVRNLKPVHRKTARVMRLSPWTGTSIDGHSAHVLILRQAQDEDLSNGRWHAFALIKSPHPELVEG